jgi:hypothetical protein
MPFGRMRFAVPGAVYRWRGPGVDAYRAQRPSSVRLGDRGQGRCGLCANAATPTRAVLRRAGESWSCQPCTLLGA